MFDERPPNETQKTIMLWAGLIILVMLWMVSKWGDVVPMG